MIEVKTRHFGTILNTLGGSEDKTSVAHILEEDEIKQIYWDRSSEDALEEAKENNTAAEEQADELEEEDEVVGDAEANRH